MPESVVSHRLMKNRHQWLRKHIGERLEARAEAGAENESLVNHELEIR